MNDDNDKIADRLKVDDREIKVEDFDVSATAELELVIELKLELIELDWVEEICLAVEEIEEEAEEETSGKDEIPVELNKPKFDDELDKEEENEDEDEELEEIVEDWIEIGARWTIRVSNWEIIPLSDEPPRFEMHETLKFDTRKHWAWME